MASITILDLAKHRGAICPDDGFTAEVIEAVGLPFMGGCVACGACVACYNSSPTKTGYIACTNGCADEIGFATVEEAEAFLTSEEANGESESHD